MRYALYGGTLGTGKRLWGWVAFWDDAEGRAEARRLLEEKDTYFRAQGYQVLPFV